MELTTQFDDAANTRFHVIKGHLTFDELHVALTQLYESSEFHPEQSSLWDLKEARLEGTSSNEVRQIAQLVRGHWGGGGSPKSALVVSEDLVFGLSRMYEIHLESNAEVRVFRDRREASEWLGYSDHDEVNTD